MDKAATMQHHNHDSLPTQDGQKQVFQLFAQDALLSYRIPYNSGPGSYCRFYQAIGVTDVLRDKNSRNVLGLTFLEAAASAIAQVMTEREIQQKGILYKENVIRPAKGAIALVSNEAVAQMLDVLKILGLHKFEDATPVDFFIKPTLMIQQDHIAPTPIESELVFHQPKHLQGHVQLLFRVIVMDPMFIDAQGKNLNLTEVPKAYVEAVLNLLNPEAFFRALGPQQLTPLFAKAGKFEGTFKANFAAAVKKWQNRSAPKDLATLQLFLQQGLLHEFIHALILQLPDRMPETLDKDEAARLQQFSAASYINLLNSATELHTTVVYTKNLIKALQGVEGLEAGPKTQNQVVRLLAMEMFCDRFSMYMYETSMKIQAYQAIMPDLGEITVDTMRRMGGQLLANPAAFKMVNNLANEKIDALLGELQAAETRHVYVSAFGDPPVLDCERAIFEPFLDLIRQRDREKIITLFTEDCSAGEMFKASRNATYIAENKSAVSQS